MDGFADAMRAAILSLPQDLKAMLRVMEDPDLDDAGRVLPCGALLHVLSGANPIPEVKGTLALVDDVLVLRLTLERLAKTSPEVVSAHREDEPEIFEPWEVQLATSRAYLGDRFSVLDKAIDGLPRLNFQGHSAKDIKPQLENLLNQLFRDIPCGTGKKGLLAVSKNKLDDVLYRGARWVVESGYGNEEDVIRIEEMGMIPDADPSCVSGHAKDRGHHQLATLGSGNHFLEIQSVNEIFDAETANEFNLHNDQIVVLIHSGSRGLGHQVCTDYVDRFQASGRRYHLTLPDRELVCAPLSEAPKARIIWRQ